MIEKVTLFLQPDAIFTTIKIHEKLGINVALLTPGKKSTHNYDEIVVKKISIQRLKNKLVKLLFPFWHSSNHVPLKEVKKYHKRNPIDFIFAYCTSDMPAIYAHAISEELCIPFIVREHKTYESSRTQIDKIPRDYLSALTQSYKLCAVSPLLAAIMKRIGIRNDIETLPIAISDNFFKKPNQIFYSEFSDWFSNDYIFAGWTRWRKIKRLDLLIKSFHKFIILGYRAKLIIAGSIEPVDNEQWVKRYINTNNLNKDILLLGVASRNEIHYLAHKIDCCVISSDYETFGLPALEALSAGKPILTTKCNGPEYLVENYDLGVTIERDSESELLKGMIEIYNQRHKYDSKLISDYAFNRFSEKELGISFSKLYNLNR